jgi:hypothetical protein
MPAEIICFKQYPAPSCSHIITNIAELVRAIDVADTYAYVVHEMAASLPKRKPRVQNKAT